MCFFFKGQGCFGVFGAILRRVFRGAGLFFFCFFGDFKAGFGGVFKGRSSFRAVLAPRETMNERIGRVSLWVSFEGQGCFGFFLGDFKAGFGGFFKGRSSFRAVFCFPFFG